nr:MAG TPA: hypothetical protein [Caudoviricetes sp.]
MFCHEAGYDDFRTLLFIAFTRRLPILRLRLEVALLRFQ